LSLYRWGGGDGHHTITAASLHGLLLSVALFFAA
jgi:hypothetical protein